MKKEQKDPIIQTKGLKMYYTVGGNTVKALDGVNIEIKKGVKEGETIRGPQIYGEEDN